MAKQKPKQESRLDLYQTEKRVAPGWIGGETEKSAQLQALYQRTELPVGSNLWLVTKELIFQHTPEPTFAHIMYALDPNTLELVIAPILAAIDMDENGECEHLATAVAYEIPVFPNRPEDVPALEAIYDRILQDGFYQVVDGEKKWLKFTEKAAPIAKVSNPADHLVTNRLLNPVELMVIRRRVTARLTELTSAQSTLNRIDLAIQELEEVLRRTKRNENELQACLTRHPILFGPEYRRIIPKHQLGDDYEMDYALELHSGLVDLVEIESSTLELFTKNGEPRKELVHAEQQVYDWLEWMEANGGYARSKLPSVHRPRAFIVIGRAAMLTPETTAKLQQRNRILSHVLEISTYDGLLDRTRHLRKLLMGVGAGK